MTPALHLQILICRAHGTRMGTAAFLSTESPELIAQEIDAVRARTSKSFAVNLIPFATDPGLRDAELDTCFARKVQAMCFFWHPVPQAIQRAKAAGCLGLHQVGSLEAALHAEAAGADVLIVRGSRRAAMSTAPLQP